MARRSKKTFSQATKEEAVAAMSVGNLTQKEIAQQYGCSVPALQLWRKELQNTPTNDWDETEAQPTEDDNYDKPKKRAKATKSRKRTAKSEDSAHEVIRKFWNQNFRGVDMLLEPKNVESAEVIRLVNEAIQFAINAK